MIAIKRARLKARFFIFIAGATDDIFWINVSYSSKKSGWTGRPCYDFAAVV